MAFQQVSDLTADNATPIGGINKKTGKKNPTSIEGYYLGSRKVENKKGESYLHILQTPSGNQGVWGKTDMDRKLTSVTPGTMVRITHTGMQQTKNGEMYKFKIEVDKENSIEVDSALGSTVTNDEDTDSGYSTEDDTSDEQTDDYEAPPAYVAQPATATSAASKARVQALLGKKSK